MVQISTKQHFVIITTLFLFISHCHEHHQPVDSVEEMKVNVLQLIHIDMISNLHND